MPGNARETSAESPAWTDERRDKPVSLTSFVDCGRPIVPSSLRSAFLGERWIAGRACAVQSSLCAPSLLVDVSFSAPLCEFIARYCYADAGEALLAMRDWDGRLDPPGPWTKEAVTGRMGPGAFDDRCS